MKAPAPLLAHIGSEEALWSAWDEVCSARGAPGIDGVSVRQFARTAPTEIGRLRSEILARRYRPKPLRRVWVPKRGKPDEFRPLAIPTVRDRVAAGSAHSVLDHVFEPTFHDCSFGFRRGRGTIGALRRMLRLRDQGMRWVARADIDGFFDHIDQHQLFTRLQPLLPWEARRLLVLWTRTWIYDGLDRFRLTSGVPQGTATSPLLANFYLTPFDQHVEFEGFDMVRYVDDLAVGSRTEGGARAALGAMRAGLEPLALRLNTRSESVRSFDEGFEFLGFEIKGPIVRVAQFKIEEFRRHALTIMEHRGGGSMRVRIAKLNRMIRGWRAYYRVGMAREQFQELDAWLEGQVRRATLERWSRERPKPRDLELAGLESLSTVGRRIFQPPPAPSLEGYEYRIPLEGSEDRTDVAVLFPGEQLAVRDSECYVVRSGGAHEALGRDLRAVVLADGANCESGALRSLLERGIALRFVASVASLGSAPVTDDRLSAP